MTAVPLCYRCPFRSTQEPQLEFAASMLIVYNVLPVDAH